MSARAPENGVTGIADYDRSMAPRQYNSVLREQSSLHTRVSILDAAERLLETKGYAKTTVAEIARLAGVATNTVYTSVGGKAEVFLALLERGTGADVIDETLAKISITPDPSEVMRLVAYAYRRSFESTGAVISVLDEAALHDAAIAGAIADAQRLYRARLDRVADHLEKLGALAIDGTSASDVLWFYFGFTAWPLLRGLAWDPGRIEAWLAHQASNALLLGSTD